MPTVSISKETHMALTELIEKKDGKVGRYCDKAILRQIHQDNKELHVWEPSNFQLNDNGSPIAQFETRRCKICGRNEWYINSIKEWHFTGFIPTSEFL